METEKKRFIVIKDPQDLWTVWDEETNEPADFLTRPLVGLSKREADSACYLLNALYERLSGDDKDAVA